MTEQPNFDKVEVLDKDTENERSYYTLNGEFHRTDGPAVEWAEGYKAWYQNGKRHRIDGPAIEWEDGTKEWHIKDEELTEEEFNERIEEIVREKGITNESVKLELEIHGINSFKNYTSKYMLNGENSFCFLFLPKQKPIKLDVFKSKKGEIFIKKMQYEQTLNDFLNEKKSNAIV